jgi:capsule polysaccharide export protein KpsE/RkpR
VTEELRDTLAGESVRTIAANLRRLAVICFVVAAGTAVWSLFAKQRYSATAVTMVPATSTGSLASLASSFLPEGLSGLGGIAADLLPGAAGGAAMDVDVVERVINSRAVLERVVLQYDLMRRYRVRTMEDALKKFRKRLIVNTSSQIGFIEITAQGETREEAASIVRDIIDFTNDELSMMVTSRARRARIEAEGLLDVAIDSLESAQFRLMEFRSETGLLFPEEQGQSMVDLLGSVETDLVLARAELSAASATLAPGNPAYREAASMVAVLEQEMSDRMTGGDSLSIFPPYDSLPGMVMQYDGLYMEVEMRRMVVLLLRQELESLRLEEARESPTLEVVDPPTPTKLRSYPKRALMVIKNAAVCFLLGALWLVVLTYFRRIMRNPSTGGYWREVGAQARSQVPSFLLKRRKQE